MQRTLRWTRRAFHYAGDVHTGVWIAESIGGIALVGGILRLLRDHIDWVVLAALFAVALLIRWASKQSTPSSAKDAPQLLIRTKPGKGGTTVFIGDGQSPILNVSLGSLTWGKEQRPLGMPTDIRVIEAKGRELRDLEVEEHPSHICGLADFMDRANRSGAFGSATVTVSYEDSRGGKFSRLFTLVIQSDESIVWTPGPVRRQDGNAVASAGSRA